MEKMKTYTIIEEREYIESVTYTVEAESEEEALRMVEDGEVDSNGDHWTRDTGESFYKVQK